MNKHIETICSDFLSDDSYAECSCGWKGEVRDSVELAAEDLVEHRKVHQ